MEIFALLRHYYLRVTGLCVCLPQQAERACDFLSAQGRAVCYPVFIFGRGLAHSCRDLNPENDRINNQVSQSGRFLLFDHVCVSAGV